jgi:hypothetical protein
LKEKALLGAPVGSPVHQASVIIQRCSCRGLSSVITTIANSLNFSKDGNSLEEEAAAIQNDNKNLQDVTFTN